MSFDCDIGHAGVSVDSAHGVSDRFVLLSNGQVTLIVRLPIPLRIDGRRVARIEKVFGQLDIFLTLAAAFHIVHETSESDQALFDLLVAVVPRFLGRGAEVGIPAVGQLLGGVVEPGVLLIGHQVVVDG